MQKLFRLAMILSVLAGMSAGMVQAAPDQDYLVFCQEDGGRKTVYLAAENNTDLQTVAGGTQLEVFLLPRHLVYYTGHRLFEYNLDDMKVKPLAQLDATEKLRQVLAYDSEGPDQAFVITGDELGIIRRYVLEFSDGSLRRIDEPESGPGSGVSATGAEAEALSSDGAAAITIRRVPFSRRLEIRLVPVKTGSDLKRWSLPQQWTTLPQFPIWSPDSRYFAFYARLSNQLNGFYDLYLFDREKGRMELVQSQVFATLPFGEPVMGEFTPSWSPDGRYLVFEYQPYGLPTESVLLRYEVGSGKRFVITGGPGQRRAPVWSPSGRKLFFIMDAKGSGPQVHWVNPDGTDERRVSPGEGTTVWAEWYRPDRG